MIPAVPPTQVVVAHVPKEFNQVSFKGNLKFLESHKIWSNFEEITKIYRESGHNGQISKYLKNRLQRAGFTVVQKRGDGTLCASRGVNKAHNNAIILQSHMDMVGISSDGNPRRPIVLNMKEGWLYANDRTLGADNGVGMAAMLAVADDARFKKFPLEMIFTTDEETTMHGASILTPKDFYGRYLINLDTEKYGTVIKGSAGISEFDVSEKIKMHAINDYSFERISVTLNGARGGHSACITPDSINPIKVLLSELQNKKVIKLVSLSGGERFNAIPREASADFLVPKNEAKWIIKALRENLEKLKQEKSLTNPDFEYLIFAQNANPGTKYVDPEFQAKMFEAMDAVPTGVLSKFEKDSTGRECYKTSQNLGVLNVSGGKFQAKIMGRSADEKEGKELQAKTSAILSELFGKKIAVTDTGPIWQPQAKSLLQDAAVSAYGSISDGGRPIVTVEHGGLEPSIFAKKKPNLQMISIGPTIEEPHSVTERVQVDTVLPFYNWLSKIIELLNKN